MKGLSQKWCIIAPLVNLNEGVEFNSKSWPLHITLADTHYVNWHSNKLLDKFTTLVNTTESFEIKALHRGVLGPIEQPTKVTFIEKSAELLSLHNRIIQLINEHSGVFNNPEWQQDGYIPHSTIQTDSELNQGDIAIIECLALIDMFPDNNGHKRKVSRIIALG